MIPDEIIAISYSALQTLITVIGIDYMSSAYKLNILEKEEWKLEEWKGWMKKCAKRVHL